MIPANQRSFFACVIHSLVLAHPTFCHAHLKFFTAHLIQAAGFQAATYRVSNLTGQQAVAGGRETKTKKIKNA
jgi:hypothetical protein